MKKMNKKLTSLLVASVLTASMAVGCGSKPAETVEEPAAEEAVTEGTTEAAENDVELTYWSMWGSAEPQGQVLQEAADAFKEKTGITVNIEWKNRDITTILPTALEAKEKIDIFEDGIDSVIKISQYCYDLTDMAAAANYSAQSYECLNNYVINKANFLCCITEQPQVGGVFYNKDIFEACDITEVPATWEEFMDVCQIIKDNGYEPVALDSAYIDLSFGYQLDRVIGRDKIAELSANGGWSENEGVITAAEQVIDFVNKGFLADGAPDEWPSSQNKIGLTGKVAMIVGANYIPAEVNANTGAEINWGMFNFPTYNGGSSNAYAGASSVGITSYSEHPQEAFDFVMFLTSGEFDQKMANTAQQIPADPRNTAPAIMDGSIEALNATSDPLDWGMGLYESGDLIGALKEVIVKLYEGTYSTGAEFAAEMDALY